MFSWTPDFKRVELPSSPEPAKALGSPGNKVGGGKIGELISICILCVYVHHVYYMIYTCKCIFASDSLAPIKLKQNPAVLAYDPTGLRSAMSATNGASCTFFPPLWSMLVCVCGCFRMFCGLLYMGRLYIHTYLLKKTHHTRTHRGAGDGAAEGHAEPPGVVRVGAAREGHHRRLREEGWVRL